MASDTEATRIQDVVKFEPGMNAGRQTLLVGASETLTVGEIVRKGASGRMVAYDAAANEKQTVKIINVSAGTFTITLLDKDGILATTDPIVFNGDAAAILAGLNTVLTSGDVEISAGTLPTNFTIHWIGEDYAGRPQQLVSIQNIGATDLDDVTVERTQVGGWGGAAANELQTLTWDSKGTGGTFTITVDHYDGSRVTTAAIAWNASLATTQTALDLVAGPTAQITLAGEIDTADDMTFTYDGSKYKGRDIKNLASIDVSSLTTTTAVVAVQTTKGGPAGSQGVGGITLKDVTTAGGALTTKSLFLTRGPAVVNVDKLDFGSSVRLDVIDQLQALGIMTRSEA